MAHLQLAVRAGAAAAELPPGPRAAADGMLKPQGDGGQLGFVKASLCVGPRPTGIAFWGCLHGSPKRDHSPEALEESSRRPCFARYPAGSARGDVPREGPAGIAQRFGQKRRPKNAPAGGSETMGISFPIVRGARAKNPLSFRLFMSLVQFLQKRMNFSGEGTPPKDA